MKLLCDSPSAQGVNFVVVVVISKLVLRVANYTSRRIFLLNQASQRIFVTNYMSRKKD